MDKICILMPSHLPVPAVEGGAVETLIQNLIIQNEKTPVFEFTVYSAYNAKAEELSKKYNFTKIKFIKVNKKLDNINFLLYRFLKKIFRIAIPERIIRWKMLEQVQPENYDWILFEAGEVFALNFYGKKLPVDKTLVHAHGMITPIPSVDKYFSYYLPISSFVGKYWKSKSGRPEHTYKCWKNCIFVEQFSKKISQTEKCQLLSKLGFTEEDFVVIFTGRIIQEKGVLELLEALDYIDNDNVKLLIVGSARFAEKSKTTYEQKIESYVKKNKKKVIFTGYIPNEEIYRYYNIAKIAIVPSVWEEPAGLVLVEAMAAGKPIITTGSGGIKEYTNEKCSIFVERGEFLSRNISIAIQRLYNDPTLLHYMEKNAIISALNFDMERYLKNLSSIIGEINESRGKNWQ